MMKKTSMINNFLKILFNENEQICVSDNEYAYRSINQSDLINKKNFKLISNDGKITKTVNSDSISLVSINPITGKRNDRSVTSHRNFLIEIDDGKIAEQFNYIENIGLPYSICVFSGNKSLHFAVCLEEPVIHPSMWSLLNNWILNIVTRADQQTKNPSRSIRFPGHMRMNLHGIKKEQKLLKLKPRITNDELYIWLSKYPDKRPRLSPERKSVKMYVEPKLEKLPPFFHEKLEKLQRGEQENRNVTWFSLACMMAERNFDIDYTIDYFGNYFNEESDFSKNEWLHCIKSAYKRMEG